MSSPCNRRRGSFFATLSLLVLLSGHPVRAQDVLSGPLTEQLSNRLTKQILQYKLDLTREIEGEFERRKQLLGAKETVERANALRQLLKSKAATYEMIEDFGRAEADFNALVEVMPQNPVTYSDRGYFYMRQSRFADAVHDFITGSRLAPSEALFSYGAGRAFYRMGQYADAVAQFGEAIRLAPNDSIAHLSRADVLTQLGKYAQARSDYDLALRLGLPRESDRFLALFGRGYANIFLGDFSGAIHDMDGALVVQPDMINAVVWRGYAHERLGQRQRALEDYETALRISPNDGWIRASISRMRS
jgi:Flp pilus assembly protein TadD